jgi:hypothetical protein
MKNEEEDFSEMINLKGKERMVIYMTMQNKR